MANTNRIVENTFALYLRSFFSLIISLYTSRLVLQNLGVDGYGVYNAVGGIVVMFSFLQSSLTIVTQRFVSYYIGKEDLGISSLEE